MLCQGKLPAGALHITRQSYLSTTKVPRQENCQEGTTITRSLHEGASKKLPGTLKALINPNAAGTGLLDLLVASLAEQDIAQARLTHSGLDFHLVQKRSMA